MWFKLTYSLAGMYLLRPDDAPVSVSLPADEGEITLRMRTFEQKEIHTELCCDAVLNRNLKMDIKDMFDHLAKRILPQDTPPVITLPYKLSFDEVVVDTDGNIAKNWALPLEIMPRRFQSISREVEKHLSELIRRFVKTLRWSQAASGGQSPFAHVGSFWSEDKTNWQIMPWKLSVRIGEARGINIGQQAIGRVTELWASNHAEPLGHQMIREALDIAGSNARSALLIGVSALEAGLKDYIQSKIPNSDILLEEMPSPSVENMAQKVIPALHKAQSAESPHFPLNKDDSDRLKKWVSQRNRVAHGIQKTVKVEELIAFLKFTRSLLYKLDFCRGHRWAESLSTLE